MPTQTAYPTYTPNPTYTPWIIVQTRIVTATFTLTPTLTQTPGPPSPTPDVALTSTAQQIQALQAPRGDGHYRINVDIAPGVWRSQGTGQECHWKVTDQDGNVLDNFVGLAGFTAYLETYGFEVTFEHCGNWVFVKP